MPSVPSCDWSPGESQRSDWAFSSFPLDVRARMLKFPPCHSTLCSMMKRGAKICVLAVVGIVMSGLVALLLMHASVFMRQAAPTSTTAQATPNPSNASTVPVERRALRGESLLPLDRATSPSESDGCGCNADRSFAPQCEDVSPSAWQLHRSVQAVGRIVVGDIHCSGSLLGNKTSAYFLTAARCLPQDEDAKVVRIELTNCLGTRVFEQNQLFHLSRQLDFAILKMNSQEINMSAYFGVLRLRASGPVEEEVIYLPHYTDISSKHIAIVNDEGLIRTREFEPASACKVPTPSSYVSYKAQATDSAALGSPLMALTDYSIVAIHLCSGCSNAALTTKAIVDDLRDHERLVTDFIAVT